MERFAGTLSWEAAGPAPPGPHAPHAPAGTAQDHSTEAFFASMDFDLAKAQPMDHWMDDVVCCPQQPFWDFIFYNFSLDYYIF